MMSRMRILRSCRALAPCVLSALFVLLLSTGGYAETCITCHTDEDLLEDNLAEVEKKTSALQAGSG
ncbi:MAG: hypothetical protein WBW79_02140 [Desulfocapsaceae bacterium]